MNNILKYLILLFLVINLSAKEPLEKVSLQLKWKYQFQFAGFLIAKEKGFYRNVGLDVDIKELEKNMDIVDEVIDKKIDFAVSDSSLIYEALKEKPILAMMVIYQHTPFVLIGLKESGKKSLKDINGAKLALLKGIDSIAIKTMLKTNSIKYLEKEPAFSLDKLLSKEVDFMTAYISNEPIIAKKKGIELISFSPEDYGFEGYGDILFTSKELQKNNPKQVKKMYMASVRGWEYAFENIDETVDIIYNKYNSLNKTKDELKDEALILKKLSNYDKNFGEINIEKVKGIAQQFNIVKEEYNKLNILNDFIYEQNQKNQKSKNVNVLLGFDKPPFIFGKTSSKGIDSDVLVEAFKLMDYKVNIFQGTKDQQETILHKQNTIIDAVATISEKNDGLFYSNNFSTYENYVITRKEDNIKINTLEDLKNFKFVTWKSSYNDLGEEFNEFFNPYTGKYKESYHDTPSQRNDAKMFFSKKVDVIIVDKAIFLWHKLHFNDDGKYDFHNIFKDKKHYPVTFKNKQLRDDFNIGLKKLKSSGRYKEILKFYETQNVEELLSFINILSNISSKYIFEEKRNKLKNILKPFFNHPDIKAISINKNNKQNLYLTLVKEDDKIKSNITYDFKDLQKVSKKIYYTSQNDLLELGEIYIYYTTNYETKNGQLIPSLEKLKNLKEDDYIFIENVYKKFNILKDTKYDLKKKYSFIHNHKPIRVCYPKKDLEPYMFDEKDNPIGISRDYLNLISNNMGIDFEYIVTNSLQEHFINLKNKTCDIVPAVIKNPNIYDFIITSDTYIYDYIGVATKIHAPYESDFNKLNGKKIGVNKAFANITYYLESLYPEIEFIKVSNNALEKVKSGELYGYIEPSSILSYKILNKYPNDLKIMRTISEKKVEGGIGINKEKAYLLPLFNDAIRKITPLERSNIIAKWQKVRHDREIDYTYIWYMLLVSSIILSIIFIAYIKQNRLKKEIELQKDKFENIFYNANDGILISTNGKFTDCNKSIIEILGFEDKKDILNLDITLISPPYQWGGQNSYDKLKIHTYNAIEDGYHNFEWLYQKADKSKSWADITITNISTDEDEILHIVLRDISDKKKLQDELEEINQTLQDKVDFEVEKNKEQQLMIIKQNRLAQMGEMISMIAHQWRQPLNNLSILNNTLILKYSKNKLNDETIEKFKENSKKQIELMSKTIDDFRNFFKPNKKKMDFKLNQVIEDSLDILKPLFVKHSITVNMKYESQLTINGYQNELGQALLNIFNNSIDALLENEIKDKTINILINDNDKDIFIELSDNAGGIKEEHQNKIFDPYFSTKIEKNGTGLGLYMTKMIIEDHMDGEIKVSNNNDGVLFKIRFPK